MELFTIYEIIGIIFIHWIGDFIAQSDWQANNKSTDNQALVHHTLSYTVIWSLIVMILFFIDMDKYGGRSVLLFILITFITHTLTDYITSRINKKLLKRRSKKMFFVSIGFDQILHYLQLFICYSLLFN